MVRNLPSFQLRQDYIQCQIFAANITQSVSLSVVVLVLFCKKQNMPLIVSFPPSSTIVFTETDLSDRLHYSFSLK